MADDGQPGDQAEVVPAQDLSVPIWVWVVLGFAGVMAVVIVMIIWAGGGDPPAGQTDDGQGVVAEDRVQDSATRRATTGPG